MSTDVSRQADSTLGLPPEMNAPSVCRGAFTGWPQMTVALEALTLYPEINQNLQKAGGQSIGGPTQLLQALAVDPSWLARTSPPQDVYAHTVWLSLRVHTAARGIALALAGLPDLLKMTGPTSGQAVRTIISGAQGLAERARDVAGLSHNLASKLAPFIERADVTSAAAQKAASTLETAIQGTPRPSGEPSIYAHARVASLANGVRARLDEMEAKGAEAGAYAVLANLATAMANLTAAWQIAAAQFEKGGGTDLASLADPAYLDNHLHRKTAADDWQAFAAITQEFLQRAVIVR